MAEAGGAAAAPPDIDPDFEPQSRPRSCTWPLPRPELPAGAAEAGGAGAAAEEGAGGAAAAAAAGPGRAEGARAGGGGGAAAAAARKGGSRRNAWGNQSYAELISQAIESAPEKRLTLAQIYEWMVRSVPYFKDKGDSNSSAGWKVRGAAGWARVGPVLLLAVPAAPFPAALTCCRSSSRCAPRRPCRYRGLAPCGSALRGPGGPPRCGAVSGSGEEPPAAVPLRVGALCAFLASSQLCWKEQSCRRGHGGAAGGFFNSRPRLFAAPLRGAPCK